MPLPLRLEWIQQKPKIVHRSASWHAPAHVTTGSAEAEHVARIVRAIERGTPLPSGYYRKGAGKNRDALLELYGAMHLHLGKWNTSELLFLVQYPDDVVLLELSDHDHFDPPLGVKLMATHASALAFKVMEIDARPKPAPSRQIMKNRFGPIPTKPPAPKPEPAPAADMAPAPDAKGESGPA